MPHWRTLDRIGNRGHRASLRLGRARRHRDALKNVVKKVLRLDRILDIVERQKRNRNIIAALIRDGRMSVDILGDRDTLNDITEQAAQRLASDSARIATAEDRDG